jgi:hypothetical protein
MWDAVVSESVKEASDRENIVESKNRRIEREE